MPWIATSTEDFSSWFAALSELEQEIVETCIRLLEKQGDSVGLPLVSVVDESRHLSMRELRPQSTDFRILFAFTPWLILLVGADQPAWRDWTQRLVPLADDLYTEFCEDDRDAGE
jgi:hypothetical protein